MTSEPDTWLGQGSRTRPRTVDRRLRQAVFVAIFLAVVGTYLDGKPRWLDAYLIDLLYVAFGGLVYVQAAYRRRNDDGLLFLPAIGLTVVLGTFFLWQGWGSGVTASAGWPTFLAVFGSFVVYPFVHPDGLDHLQDVPTYVVAVIALGGAFFYHPATGGDSFPVRVGFLLVMNVLFLPRYLSRRTFLRTAAGAAGLVSALGLVAYAVGDYAVFSVPVAVRPGAVPLPPGLGRIDGVLQSVFVNPNGTGLLLFVGVFAGIVEGREAVSDGLRVGPGVVATGLVVLNGLGLFLTHSRASWAAAAIAVGVYFAYAEYGPRALPYAVTAAFAVPVVGLLAIAAGVVGVDPSGRFALWTGATEAFLADPSLFGEGIVGSDDVIAPHVSERYAGHSAHNSYLVTAIRAGIVGTVGYLVLAVGSVVDAAYRRKSGDLTMVGLAVAFAVHQLFEAYSLFHYLLGSVLAALAVGYVVVGNREDLVPGRQFRRR